MAMARHAALSYQPARRASVVVLQDALRRPELADLSVGAPADLTVLRLVEGEFSYRDADANPLTGHQALEPTHVIKDGELYDV